MRLFTKAVDQNCFLYATAHAKGLLTPDVSEADFLLLPFNFELIAGNEKESLDCYNIGHSQYLCLKKIAEEFECISVATGKKIIVFFYHDNCDELPFTNAIIFRTSWKRSLKQANVYGMPAFIDGLKESEHKAIIKKPELPTISFRGQSVPMELGWKTRVRDKANTLLRKFGIDFQVNVFYPPNYISRGKAINSLLKYRSGISFDLVLQTHNGAHNHPQKFSYLESLQQNAYILCIAGWGNYSYRFYETLREGRIPVFVDTDCLLPCDDEIDWKKHVVWIDRHQETSIAKTLLSYHNTITPVQFSELQVKNKILYNMYFTKNGFAEYVLRFLSTNAS